MRGVWNNDFRKFEDIPLGYGKSWLFPRGVSYFHKLDFEMKGFRVTFGDDFAYENLRDLAPDGFSFTTVGVDKWLMLLPSTDYLCTPRNSEA